MIYKFGRPVSEKTKSEHPEWIKQKTLKSGKTIDYIDRSAKEKSKKKARKIKAKIKITKKEIKERIKNNPKLKAKFSEALRAIKVSKKGLNNLRLALKEIQKLKKRKGIKTEKNKIFENEMKKYFFSWLEEKYEATKKEKQEAFKEVMKNPKYKKEIEEYTGRNKRYKEYLNGKIEAKTMKKFSNGIKITGEFYKDSVFIPYSAIQMIENNRIQIKLQYLKAYVPGKRKHNLDYIKMPEEKK